MGDTVGLAVGLAVGLDVGLDVGLVVGLVVGDADGDVVGLVVGEAVGLTVSLHVWFKCFPSQPCRRLRRGHDQLPWHASALNGLHVSARVASETLVYA